MDTLQLDLDFSDKYDLIISNPPYVTASEKTDIQANVLDFEPHLALFVSDGDPLLFYRHITNFAKNSLNVGAGLFFEINEKYGKETAQLLIDAGFVHVKILQDIHGKDRMVQGQF